MDNQVAIGWFAAGAVESVRRNPVPALLVGAGVGYWWLDSYQRGREQARFRTSEPAQSTNPRDAKKASGSRAKQHTVKRAGRASREAVQSAKQTMREEGDALKGRVQDASQQAVDYGKRAKLRTESMYYENPLAFAGVCLAAGAGQASLPDWAERAVCSDEYR